MAKFKKSDYKKHQNVYSVMGKIGDIIFYPVIILTLICCFAIFSTKDENKMPFVLGVSIASISSPSMTKAGFEVGDVVIVTKTNTEKLRCGDIIAFYEKFSNSSNLKTIQTYDMETHTVVQEFDTKTFQDLRSQTREESSDVVNTSSTRILFHRIIGIYMSEDGKLFYKTQGDSNYSPDGTISEDVVVGKYFTTPQFIRSSLQFIGTATGMITLIVAPLCILTLFMLFSIIEQLSKMGIERRVLRRELRYDDPEVIKANIGIEMETADKAKFYATTPEEEKNAVANFLWGYLNVKDKDELTYSGIMHALTYLDENPNKYWLYFLGTTKSKFQRRLIHKAWQEWIKEEKVKEVKKRGQKKSPQSTTIPGKIVPGKSAPVRPKRTTEEKTDKANKIDTTQETKKIDKPQTDEKEKKEKNSKGKKNK